MGHSYEVISLLSNNVLREFFSPDETSAWLLGLDASRSDLDSLIVQELDGEGELLSTLDANEFLHAFAEDHAVAVA